MIRFYGSPMSSAARTHWMLEEIAVPYEYIQINSREGGTKTPEFLKVSPKGKIPVIQDGDMTISESVAINWYLAEKYGKDLLPSSPKEKSEALEWSLWSISNLQPHVLAILMNAIGLPEDERSEKAIDRARANIKEYLAVLEGALTGKDWLVGNRFSVADVNLASVLSYAKAMGTEFEEFPSVHKYLERCESRPAFEKTH